VEQYREFVRKELVCVAFMRLFGKVPSPEVARQLARNCEEAWSSPAALATTLLARFPMSINSKAVVGGEEGGEVGGEEGGEVGGEGGGEVVGEGGGEVVGGEDAAAPNSSIQDLVNVLYHEDDQDGDDVVDFRTINHVAEVLHSLH
jgi:hypothetical protein